MIADLDETLRQLLIEDLPEDYGKVDVKFEQPTREWAAKLNDPTINLFLYDVRENVTLRRHQWEQVANGNGRSGRPDVARMKRSPYRVDCHYMVTTWAADPDDEHRLLTGTLLALFRHPVLPEEKMAGAMEHQPYDVATALARHDKLTNPAEIWSALDNEIRPTVSYVVTLALDPWSEVLGGLPVRTRTLRSGQATELPPTRQRDLAATNPYTVVIGGTVWAEDTPQAGIEVAIKGTGHFATTGNDGRFRLGGVPPGDYTLVAWPPEGRPREEKVSIPASKDDDYDVML